MKLYHGTKPENIESIKRDGLKANVPQDVDFLMFPERGGEFAGVSLANVARVAAGYGEAIVEVEVDGGIEIEMFGEVLIPGDVPASAIKAVRLVTGKGWIESESVNNSHIVISEDGEWTNVMFTEEA